MQQKIGTIVGVWEVNAPDAPFPCHMITFAPYGTLLQSNPHEGNREESDSNGHGVWQIIKQQAGKMVVMGKFIEFKASKNSGKYIGKGVIEFMLIVRKNSFSGSSRAYTYDSNNMLVKGPLISPITGTRVILDKMDLTKKWPTPL